VLGGYPFGWLESWVLVLVSTKSELGLSFLELELRLNPDPVLEPNLDQLVLEPELKKI
jgi:hypothetical protein